MRSGQILQGFFSGHVDSRNSDVSVADFSKLQVKKKVLPNLLNPSANFAA